MELQFDLRREHHAIGEFTASLHFFQGISAATFTGVTERLREIATELDLPSPVPVQVFQFTLGPQGAVPGGSPTLPASSLGFQRFSKEGEVAESVTCDADSITYVLRDYTIWEDTAPKLVGILSRLASEYIKEVPAIQSVRLQYLNEFQARSAEVQSAAALFKADNQWVAPLAHAATDPWHSHVGLFIPINENERHLVNVNCDIARSIVQVRSDARLAAKVLVLAGAFYNVPGGQPLIVPSDKLSDTLVDKLKETHALEKSVLREVISDPYLEAMGANDVD